MARASACDTRRADACPTHAYQNVQAAPDFVGGLPES